MDRKYYTGEQILDALSEVGVGAGDISEVMSCLGRMPSAEPETIYCKDCKHWYPDADTGMACEFTNMSQPDDGFCNWAERRTK